MDCLERGINFTLRKNIYKRAKILKCFSVEFLKSYFNFSKHKINVLFILVDVKADTILNLHTG